LARRTRFGSVVAVAPTPQPSAESISLRWCALALVAAVGLVYTNSLSGPFVFDDLLSITENPTIRQLWPLTAPLSPPSGQGLTVEGRPLLNLSLALNYAISGTAPWNYHLTNIAIHALATLTLFGLLRRTLTAAAIASTAAMTRLAMPAQAQDKPIKVGVTAGDKALSFWVFKFIDAIEEQNPLRRPCGHPEGSRPKVLVAAVSACARKRIIIDVPSSLIATKCASKSAHVCLTCPTQRTVVCSPM
jgi:hypothetical protein